MGMKLFEAGLNYIKFHTDAADDFSIKQIRGKQADFSGSYKKILDLLKIKKENDYKTTVVVTMLDLNKSNQQEEFEKLKKKFEGEDVYIYLKSQDQLWFDQTGAKTKAIHWLEPCQFPWSSMTIKSNGECAQCVEDYNKEIILGDAKEQSLIEIWNSNKYYEFRWLHILMDKKVKCTQECDMKLVGEYIKNKT
jgi:radical SAM protein with 4Fe4S-binding SPASM domain